MVEAQVTGASDQEGKSVGIFSRKNTLVKRPDELIESKQNAKYEIEHISESPASHTKAQLDIPIISISNEPYPPNNGTNSVILMTSRKKRFLIVDDDVFNLKVLSKLINNLGEKEVTTVLNGHQALEELEKAI